MRRAGNLWTCLIPLVFLTALCAGLELDLDLDPAVQVGSRTICGALRCVEESSAPLKAISSLTIFKNTLSKPHDKNSHTQEVMVASLTSDQPRISRISNGIKVEGILDGGRASLTLEIAKTIDCLADFSCRLRSVDANGQESVTSARVQQSKQRGQTGSQSFEPSVSLQILDIVHQLKAELTMINKFTEKLDEKVATLDKNVNINMALVSNKVETLDENLKTEIALVSKSTEELKNEFGTVDTKIDSSQRYLQDTIMSLQNRIEDKLHDNVEEKLGQVHMKIMAFTQNSETLIETVRKSLNESVTELGLHLQREQKEALIKMDSASHNLLDNQSNATDALLSITRNLTTTQAVLQKELIENLAQAVGEISESGENISKALNDDFGLLKGELVESFQDLASNVNHSALATLSSAQNLLMVSNSTAEATAMYLLSPKRCFKRMGSRLSHASYPYPVIQPGRDSVLDVPYLCDTDTDGGGWIIIQRRTTGDVDFFRGWEDYKNGFGDLRGDFWLGNENIHRITSSGSYELRVELVYKGKSAYARYGRFSIADETNKYRLTVGEYSGTAGDSLAYHNGAQFTTLDRDNDNYSRRQCADSRGGAWWYRSCAHSNLNGRWQASDIKALSWATLSGQEASLSYSEMKVRNKANS